MICRHQQAAPPSELLKTRIAGPPLLNDSLGIVVDQSQVDSVRLMRPMRGGELGDLDGAHRDVPAKNALSPTHPALDDRRGVHAGLNSVEPKQLRSDGVDGSDGRC